MVELLDTLEAKVDPKRAALVVIDVQHDFCAPDGWLARTGRDMSAIESMLPRLERFVDEARAVGMPIVFVLAQYDEAFNSRPQLELRRRWEGSDWPCQSGTKGIELYRLKREPEDRVVFKHRYSAFIHTDLEVVLHQLGVESLILTGVVTNGCVESTARDAFMLDYYVTLVSDCCATYDQMLHKAALANISRLFGVVHTADDIAAAWARALPLPQVIR